MGLIYNKNPDAIRVKFNRYKFLLKEGVDYLYGKNLRRRPLIYLTDKGMSFLYATTERRKVNLFEGNFYYTLVKLFGDSMRIETQVKRDKYVFDFFIPKLDLHIEYDEEHHRGEAQKSKDDRKGRVVTTLIRVRKGHEIDGIREIIKLMANLLFDKKP